MLQIDLNLRRRKATWVIVLVISYYRHYLYMQLDSSIVPATVLYPLRCANAIGKFAIETKGR